MAVPLDGAACSFSCPRAPARGAAVASPSPTVACSGRRGEASFGGGEASERKGLGAGRGDGQEICERT